MRQHKIEPNQERRVFRWPSYASPLTEASLQQLFDGAIPAIVLPRLINLKDCDTIVANLKALGMGTYGHVSHPVGRFGLAQMEYHLKKTKLEYFQKVPDANRAFGQAIAGAKNPIEELVGFLRHATSENVGIATESEFGEMFAGTFRNVMSLGHKHFDFAPIEAQGWDISKIQSQLSWNLYLNQPVGGDLVVYNRPYSTEDESLRVPNQYYYRNSIVDNCDVFRYTPQVGDIVLFNSRNIHEVEPVTGDRFSLSSFIGRLTDSSLILWS